ncbi:MAG: pyridoxamine 5-phosphate oxidase [Candidatus Dormibacteraeota bacterium]|nr:pyridoxamine 5-phosphate oxidase [Candidatus Dormibacteraeota bacterium]
MPSWGEFATQEPAFATRVLERLRLRRHLTIATLRRDGSPRISGTELELGGSELHIGVMPGAVKGADLRADPRFALHGPTEDPQAGAERDWPGEAKVAGRAVEVDFPDAPATGALRFCLDVEEVVLTHLNETGDRMVIESWHPGRGYRRFERD